MHKRRDFLVRSAAALLTFGLTRSRVSTFSASVRKEERDRRPTLFVGGPNASDSNPGNSVAPLATVQAAAVVATPGTEVRIRDGTYRETVIPANSGTQEAPIVFTADTRSDGTLAEPVISGADLLTTGWTQTADTRINTSIRSNVYETTITLPAIDFTDHDIITSRNTVLMAHQVFAQSKMMQEARWPHVPLEEFGHPMQGVNHSRILSYDEFGITWQSSSVTGSRTVTDPGLPNLPPDALVGAVYTHYSWFMPVASRVIASSGQSFTFDAFGWNDAGDLFGGGVGFAEQRWAANYKDAIANPDVPMRYQYHLRGALALLASEGEWFYESSSNKLYMWAPGGGPPQNIEYKARNYGFNLTGRSHIHLKHLNFFACDIPTNGDSVWPSNAKEWDCEQPTLYYTETERPLYATVKEKADALGVVAGAFPHANTPGSAIVPVAANGIVIDYCRFKYLNHQNRLVISAGPERNLPLSVHQSIRREIGSEQGNGAFSFGNMHRCGVRLTGDDCIVRNSVFDMAAGSHVVVTGRNCSIENNYFKDSNYIGNFSAGVLAPEVALRLRVYGNTFWRTGRSHLSQVGPYAEVSFNDWCEYGYLNGDGGGNYTMGRSLNDINHTRTWDEMQYTSYLGNNLLGKMERPASLDFASAFFLRGANWHHNWGHSARSFRQHIEQGGAIYFDDSTDGAVVHHNVSWNTIAYDIRYPNSRCKYANTPLGITWLYNNTLGTPSAGTDGYTQASVFNLLTPAFNINQIRNNVFRGIGKSGGTRPSEIGHGTVHNLPDNFRINNAPADSYFIDHLGAYNSDAGNGKPWLIGFGLGEYPQGLGFVPSRGTAPQVGQGVSVSSLTWPDDIHTDLAGGPMLDALGRPINYVDDPYPADEAPSAGAYEPAGRATPVPGAPRYYNNPGHPAHGAWIPGCSLSKEFIEGQPWERQWGTNNSP